MKNLGAISIGVASLYFIFGYVLILVGTNIKNWAKGTTLDEDFWAQSIFRLSTLPESKKYAASELLQEVQRLVTEIVDISEEEELACHYLASDLQRHVNVPMLM